MQPIIMSLPVRNLNVTRAFFAEVGFAFCPELSGPGAACLKAGENVRVLLVAEERFRERVNGDASTAWAGGDVLITLPVGSEQEVDEIVTRAVVAGARPWPVLDERPVYSAAFRDPDGHLWQVACVRQPVHRRHAVAEVPVAA